MVLHGYAEWNTNLFKKLRGMFSIAIYDQKNKQLILARDRLGIKPLYFSQLERTTIFASEIGSLLESGLAEKKINFSALYAYLFLGYVPQEMNLIDGISSVDPGNYLIFSESGMQQESFWEFPQQDQKKKFNKHEVIQETREILEQSVHLHTQSDVPLGVFLSGGIDSTVITALVSKKISNVKTLSVGFSDGPDELNELDVAKRTSRYYGTDHTQHILTGRDVKERIPKIIKHIDSPSFDGINTYIVSEMAKKSGLTVALSGCGGDELFGGYEIFNIIPKLSLPLKIWKMTPPLLKKLSTDVLSKIVKSKDRRNKIKRLRNVQSYAELYASVRADSWPNEIDKVMYRDYFSDQIGQKDLFNLFSDNQAIHDPWRFLQNQEMKNYVGWRLLRDTDSMSMANSLEVRVPFLDDKLISHVFSLASGWHHSLGWPKKLLVESTKDILPDFILHKKKQGFQLPMDVWMKNELKPLIEDVFSSESIKKRGLFKEKEMSRLRHKFYQNEITYTEVWKYVVLELWLREHDIVV